MAHSIWLISQVSGLFDESEGHSGRQSIRATLRPYYSELTQIFVIIKIVAPIFESSLFIEILL